jgi:hypothetical protein
LGLLLLVGYFYGIARGNLNSAFSHFWFDCSLAGVYIAQLWRKNTAGDPIRNAQLQHWVFLLLLWPVILVFMPGDPFLIRLVGLRSNAFFLPLILLGARLTEDDFHKIGCYLSWLNLIALWFGLAEYVLGISRFIPENVKTVNVYMSRDVVAIGEQGYYRIPSCFSVAHAYGGTMVMTIPFLFGLWMQPRLGSAKKSLCVAGMLAAIFGVMLSATRINFVVLVAVLLVANTTVKIRPMQRLAFVVLLIVVGIVVAQHDRLQRFTSLEDQTSVKYRISESVNSGFWDLLVMYPMGNGLASGGTSLPYFLQSSKRQGSMHIENEYVRVLLEEGVIGLCLVAGFIGWLLTRGVPRAPGTQVPVQTWSGGRGVALMAVAGLLGSGLIGIGVFVSTPQSALMLLCCGWIGSGGPWMRAGNDRVRVVAAQAPQLLWPRRLVHQISQ